MDNNQKIQKLKQLFDEGIISQEDLDSRIQQITSAESETIKGDNTESAREIVNVEAMNICPNCGTKGNVMFCPECGTKMIDEEEFIKSSASEKVCPQCGYKGDYAFCPECGSEMMAAISVNNQGQKTVQDARSITVEQTTPGQNNEPLPTKKVGKEKKKLYAAIGACVVFLIVIIAVIVGTGGTQTIEYEDYSFKIPDYYGVVQDDSQMAIYTADNSNAMLILSTYYEPSYTVSSFNENKDVIMESLAAGMVGDDLLAISSDGSFSGVEIGGATMDGRADGFYNEDTGDIYFVVILQDEGSNKNYTKKVDNIVKSANRLY